MADSKNDQPTDAELSVLRILWRLGPSRFGAIAHALEKDRKLAPTTVATVLKRMKDKGQVMRITSKGVVVWQARLSREKTGSKMLRNLVNRLFEGSARMLVLHLLESGELSEKDQREIRVMLAEKSKKTSK